MQSDRSPADILRENDWDDLLNRKRQAAPFQHSRLRVLGEEEVPANRSFVLPDDLPKSREGREELSRRLKAKEPVEMKREQLQFGDVVLAESACVAAPVYCAFLQAKTAFCCAMRMCCVCCGTCRLLSIKSRVRTGSSAAPLLSTAVLACALPSLQGACSRSCAPMRGC